VYRWNVPTEVPRPGELKFPGLLITTLFLD